MSDSTILKCGETPGKGLFPPNSKPVAVQGKWWFGPGKGSFPPGFEERSPKQSTTSQIAWEHPWLSERSRGPRHQHVLGKKVVFDRAW